MGLCGDGGCHGLEAPRTWWVQREDTDVLVSYVGPFWVSQVRLASDVPGLQFLSAAPGSLVGVTHGAPH